MKKLYPVLLSTFLFAGIFAQAQNFTYTNIDMAKSGNPGDELIFQAQLINSTSSSITLRVTRQQNVMNDAPTWTSAFCMDVCYLPSTDSVTYTFVAQDTVEFSFHMYTSSTPDHASAIMRWKNTGNPSNTFDQEFFGSTDGTSAVNEAGGPTAQVSIYPMPLKSNDIFAMNISGISKADAATLVVYNIYGSEVASRPVIDGVNLLSLDLPGGVYAYSIISGGKPVNAGKIVMAQ